MLIDFESEDTLTIARQLIGRELIHATQEGVTSGYISEVEAYLGKEDKASHAYGGRRTHRTEVIYLSGGHIYVYLCYGIHWMLNIVTGPVDRPHAILIRGIIPSRGIELMRKRRNGVKDGLLCNGPGKLSQAMAIDAKLNAIELGGQLRILKNDLEIPEDQIEKGPRIGIDYAGEDASLPYRFLWEPKDYTTILEKARLVQTDGLPSNR